VDLSRRFKVHQHLLNLFQLQPFRQPYSTTLSDRQSLQQSLRHLHCRLKLHQRFPPNQPQRRHPRRFTSTSSHLIPQQFPLVLCPLARSAQHLFKLRRQFETLQYPLVHCPQTSAQHLFKLRRQFETLQYPLVHCPQTSAQHLFKSRRRYRLTPRQFIHRPRKRVSQHLWVVHRCIS
jgi:hypothetical protein